MRKSARTLLATLACSASVLVTAVPAGAQVVIMRKMMPFKPSAEPIFENPVSTKPGEEPVVTNPNAYYSWVVAPWEQKGVCGSQGTQTRAVNCKRTDGTIVPDSRCIGNGSGPKPIGAQSVEITQTCGYQWDTGDWIDPGSACTTSEKQTRDVFCRRSDGKVTTDDYCGSGKPLDKQTVPDFSACSYKWAPGSWSEPTNQCGASTQTREVTCERSNGDRVSDDLCNAGGAGAKPGLTQQAYVITGCKANWSPSAWGTPVPACGTSTQTRTVTCLRADGVTVSDDQCILEKPATTQPVKDYTTCIDGRTPENPWGWTVGQYGPPSTTCGQAIRTRSVVCTDDDGGAVPDSRCRLAKPQAELKSLETSSCTFKWEVGEYGPFQPACGKTARVRSVVCMRSDGTAMSDGACSAVGAKPAMTEPYTDYSACTFGWAVGTWGAWSSTCGTGTQTRSVVCQRSDGTAATEDNCKLEKPASTQTGYQTTGCTFGWQSGQWQSPEACGDVTQTRTVQCVRSDGQVIEDATCAAMFAKPTGTQAGKNYATCSYAWAVGSYGGWSTTCGRATSARTVTCQRSDGVNVSDASCASVGAKPEATQVSEQTSGCTFSWKADIWQAPAPACGTSVQSRTVTCTRSDGTVADPSRCTAAMPATQQAANDYSTCGYTWEASNWNSNDLCGESAIQTRSVMCRRSDGPTTTDQNCIIYGAGPKPASSQTVSTFTGCGYSWRVAYGAWSSTCSDSATRINTVTCQRSDGVAVDDSMCAGEVPARQNTQGVYSTCTYAATYSTEFGQCKPSTTNGATGYQLAPIQSCRRSDGTIVDNAMCNPQQKSQSCVVASGQNFIRQPYYLQDPNYFSFSQQSMNTDTSNELRFVVQNTICYDTANRSYPSDSYCNGQPYGANTYDIASVPATYVPSMREIWVSQADLMALAPRGWVYGYIDMRDYCSRTPSIYVRSGGTNQTWVVRCGTPDTSNHYVRAPSTLADPVSILPAGVRAKNQSSTASVYNMAVQNTMCYDTISKSSVNATKCQYLPSGTSVYDIVSIPAVFVKELREIWLAPADFKAALPYGGYIGYYDATTTCNSGFTASIGTEGSFQSWTVRCGTPDRADRYVRSPSVLVDPGSVATPSQLTNSSVNASVYKMLVSNTMCYDTFGRTSASYSKCQYLSTGANVYDLVSIPATFVKDLREIYVQRTDLQAALQYGNQLGSGYYSLDYVCQYGMSAYVYPNGAAGSSVGGQGWTLRCGAPDSPANYARVPTGLADAVSAGMPAGSDVWLNPEGASSLKLAVRYVDCINVNTKGSVASSKCQYLTSGTNVYDVLSVPATFVKDLRTIYVDKDKLNALFPRGYGDIGSRDVNYFCQYGTMYVGNASGYASYNVRCTAPDSGDHYTRYATRYDDPFQYYSDGQSPARYVNDSNRSSLTLTVRETGCYDTAANRNGYDACSYVPSGPRGYDQVSVPAVWDVQNKRVTVSKADLKALSALTPETAYTNYVCGRSVYASYGGTGYYTVVCN